MITRFRTWLGWKIIGKEDRQVFLELIKFRGTMIEKLGPSVIHEIYVKNAEFVIVEETAKEAGAMIH